MRTVPFFVLCFLAMKSSLLYADEYSPFVMRSLEATTSLEQLGDLELSVREEAVDLLREISAVQPRECALFLLQRAYQTQDPEEKYRLVEVVRHLCSKHLYCRGNAMLGVRLKPRITQGGFEVLEVHLPPYWQSYQSSNYLHSPQLLEDLPPRFVDIVDEVPPMGVVGVNPRITEQTLPVDSMGHVLMVGDILLAVEGKRFTAAENTYELEQCLSCYSAGERIVVTVLREGKEQELMVQLLDRGAGNVEVDTPRASYVPSEEFEETIWQELCAEAQS